MLVLGDCFEELKKLGENSIDALVTDPPAGISFMGKAWDSNRGGRLEWIKWMSDVMRECMRVMKPGAHGLVWAIPRTSHWTATALEEAGFEIRDVITHHFGSGFPKSLDVSKAIDKAAGAEREVVAHGPKLKRMNGGSFDSEERRQREAEPTYITAPNTDAAKQWQGWGTALKPASEHWILVRKPISEKTVAANVLKWGTGALNIDASRILSDVKRPDKVCTCGESLENILVNSAAKKTGPEEAASLTSIAALNAEGSQVDAELTTHSNGSTKRDTSGLSSGTIKKESIATFSSIGTFGVSQSHQNTSSTTSTRTSKTTESKICNSCSGLIISECTQDSLTNTQLEAHKQSINAAGAQRGRFPANLVLSHSEFCTDEQCDIECPIAIMDAQSGSLRARGNVSAKQHVGDYNASSYKFGNRESGFSGDSGGASRFFYCAKVSPSERNAGCDELPDVLISGDVSLRQRGVHGQTGAPNKPLISKNHHPTVKPKKLMSYLIKLITPPNGVVLDPFMGSGSTGIAAKECGFSFIGIEREQDYFEIAQKRIDAKGV